MSGVTYTATVKFAPAGTPYSGGQGKPSLFGHVWIETGSSDGEFKSMDQSIGE